MTRETQSQLLGEFYAEKKNVIKLKSEDYANEDVLSNFKTSGANCSLSPEQQCLSLIATKVARLGNLLSGKIPNNESVSDSILDLSNYTDLLYCLVNEEKSNQKSAIIEIMKQDEKDGLYDEPKTKRWENVKPKGIIHALKEEVYEPKVGDKYRYKNGVFEWEIQKLDGKRIYSKSIGKDKSTQSSPHQAFLNEVENGGVTITHFSDVLKIE